MAIIKTKQIVNEEFESYCLEDEVVDFVICKRPDKLKNLIAAIQPNKQVHFVSNGDFSQYDLVIELLNVYYPAEVYITTFALREYATKQLINAIDKNKIVALNVLLETRIKTRDDVYEIAKKNFTKVGLTSIHAKVTVIKSPKGCVVICGSANWTKNARIENGIISMSENVANFHIDWITKTMDNAEIFK
jgi:hypothetical protein